MKTFFGAPGSSMIVPPDLRTTEICWGIFLQEIEIPNRGPEFLRPTPGTCDSATDAPGVGGVAGGGGGRVFGGGNLTPSCKDWSLKTATCGPCTGSTCDRKTCPGFSPLSVVTSWTSEGRFFFFFLFFFFFGGGSCLDKPRTSC